MICYINNDLAFSLIWSLHPWLLPLLARIVRHRCRCRNQWRAVRFAAPSVSRSSTVPAPLTSPPHRLLCPHLLLLLARRGKAPAEIRFPLMNRLSLNPPHARNAAGTTTMMTMTEAEAEPGTGIEMMTMTLRLFAHHALAGATSAEDCSF
jgi:hypothetical protein